MPKRKEWWIVRWHVAGYRRVRGADGKIHRKPIYSGIPSLASKVGYDTHAQAVKAMRKIKHKPKTKKSVSHGLPANLVKQVR